MPGTPVPSLTTAACRALTLGFSPCLCTTLRESCQTSSSRAASWSGALHCGGGGGRSGDEDSDGEPSTRGDPQLQQEQQQEQEGRPHSGKRQRRQEGEQQRALQGLEQYGPGLYRESSKQQLQQRIPRATTCPERRASSVALRMIGNATPAAEAARRASGGARGEQEGHLGQPAAQDPRYAAPPHRQPQQPQLKLEQGEQGEQPQQARQQQFAGHGQPQQAAHGPAAGLVKLEAGAVQPGPAASGGGAGAVPPPSLAALAATAAQQLEQLVTQAFTAAAAMDSVDSMLHPLRVLVARGHGGEVLQVGGGAGLTAGLSSRHAKSLHCMQQAATGG